MSRRLILAIDQGSTNSKAVVFDDQGLAVARGSRALSTQFPQAGWVEQDPLEIWSSVVAAVQASLDGIDPAEIVAVGVSNQRESAIVWDRASGEPMGPCVTWQCRRTSPLCDELRRAGQGPLLEAITGLAIDPLFSASKMRWLLDAIPNGAARAAAGELCVGTVDSWLIWKLTNGAVHATDASNASRTQLLDIVTGAWSAALLDLFDIPAAALPEIRASNAHFGAVATPELSIRAPITGVAGDSHAAMFGHAAFQPGVVKATFGTGSSLMSLAPGGARDATGGLSTTVAWRLGDALTTAFEGNIASTGATLEWVGLLFGAKDDAGAAAAELASQTPDSAGVFIVPAFAGLGAPHWDDQARGLICGLTRGNTQAHIARAALESIAFQVADVFDAMEAASGTRLAELRADGGASRNDTLMQFQADILGRPVVRDRSLDLSARGVACLAGLGIGQWDLAAVSALPREVDRFEPRAAPEKTKALRAAWRTAIERTKLRPSTGELQP
jgi:glycerol kinase